MKRGSPWLRKKILLVDDSETSLTTARVILGHRPYDLVLARNGQEAVRRAVHSRPDLILMDVAMPRMDGLEAVRALRSRPDFQAVPIILLTSGNAAEDADLLSRSGCSDYVTKPLNAPELLAKVRSYLGE